MFGNKSLMKRVAKAVEPSLETQRALVVSCTCTHPPSGSARSVLLGLPAIGAIDTWILTLTDRRVIVHKGNNMNAARSTFLGAAPRERVTMLSAEPAHGPKHLVLSFDGDAGHDFEVPLVWRGEAARFAVVSPVPEHGGGGARSSGRTRPLRPGGTAEDGGLVQHVSETSITHPGVSGPRSSWPSPPQASPA